MTSSLLVGIDGSERSIAAARWAVRHARLIARAVAGEAPADAPDAAEPAAAAEPVAAVEAATTEPAAAAEPSPTAEPAPTVTLLYVLDKKFADAAGIALEEVDGLTHDASERVIDACREEDPTVTVVTTTAIGEPAEVIARLAANHAAVVVGSHHGATIGEVVGGAIGLRISVQTNTPTIVVPADWTTGSEPADGRVLVAVGPDEVSERAVAVGTGLALASGLPLELMSAWGLPTVLSAPAKAMGGGLDPVGEQMQRELNARVEAISAAHPGLRVTGRAVEGPSPAKVLIDEARGATVLVMGTHGRSALGRAVFGSVTHGVLQGLVVPTAIVPQA